MTPYFGGAMAREQARICRGAEPTGFLEKLAVPFALEQAFEELWQQSSNSLPKLWEKLSSRPDHVKSAARYDDVPVKVRGHRVRMELRIKLTAAVVCVCRNDEISRRTIIVRTIEAYPHWRETAEAARSAGRAR